jgi:hypothetical protein
MIFSPIAGLLAILHPASETVTTMTQAPHTLRLDVEQLDGSINVRLTGDAVHAQEVSYTLEVSGNSTSRHRGRTTWAAGASAVLSTMRASVGANWCVKLVAEEAGQAPYEITRGPCDGAAS